MLGSKARGSTGVHRQPRNRLSHLAVLFCAMLIRISPSRFVGKPMTLHALAAADYAVEIDGTG